MEANQSTALVAAWGGSRETGSSSQVSTRDSYSFLTLGVNGDNPSGVLEP